MQFACVGSCVDYNEMWREHGIRVGERVPVIGWSATGWQHPRETGSRTRIVRFIAILFRMADRTRYAVCMHGELRGYKCGGSMGREWEIVPVIG